MVDKAIGFDYGGVIAGVPGKEFNKRVCEFLNVRLDQYREAYFKFNHLMNNGQVTGPELWRMVLTELGKDDQYDEFIEFQSRLPHHEVHSNMLRLVDALRKNGYKVGLLSNNTLKAAKHIRATGLVDHFDVCVISAEVGMSKPDPKIFEYFFSRLGVSPEEAIFIDDAEKSLSTASEVGYHPVFFDSYEGLIHELGLLGVKTV
ncbi:MAG: hypothetical protein A3B31_01580 [Candidatus Komeilibacteria bacterium RIFCSPLOWO2_01_FULL_53_11]|uniref:Haloacid dehalogenase n=1 Tax=Candidatus Komeilibacteria bacterium RIFCSPLOWO2_01_FULL_53_11 TaxID=1798552 RepID=A0A1G2BPG7_9BACT|nr:MAG: hypothetical protein A3B31_01580 [Candidatus Komeilibacteria bacterium RIFCSPLOWO2_01_FULL_53_11]